MYIMDPLFQMQQTIQHSILNYMSRSNSMSSMNNQTTSSIISGSSGNEMFDMIFKCLMTFLVVSIVSSSVAAMKDIPNGIKGLVTSPIRCAPIIYYYIRGLFKGTLHTKSITIEKITDERQINPLYNAVIWYLTNQVNLDDELSIKCTVDQKIDNTKRIPNIQRRIHQNSLRIFVFEGREIRYQMSEANIEIDGDEKPVQKRNDTIQCWTDVKYKNDKFLDKFIQNCIHKYASYIINKNNTRMVYQNMNGKWEKVSELPEKIANTIILKNNDKDYLVGEINHFINNKEWYVNHGYPYSLGLLLYGTPGCGKTSIIRYLSNLSERNTHYLRLSQVKSENEFNQLLKDVDLSTTILIMEDIDCATKAVHKRAEEIAKCIETAIVENNDNDVENSVKDNHIIVINNTGERDSNKLYKEKEENQVTLDVLLNILDGILTTPGQMVVMTTNKKNVLDEALIRPGRVDINLELHKCDVEMIRLLFDQFYKDILVEQVIDYITNIYELIDKIDDDLHSPAHIMNVFRKYRNDPQKAIENI